MEESPSLLDAPGEGDETLYVSTNGDADGTGEDGASTVPQATYGVRGTVPSEGTRPRKKRGRHAKDPLGQSVIFQCSRLEDLETGMREYLANPTHPAEHTTLEFSFPVTAAFLIPAREALGSGDPNDKKTPFSYSLFKKSAVSVVDALHNIPDPKEQMITQKRISKSLVDAISEIDGFHYSFHNHWLSNADQANRFSYYCNDSILNKGRAANEGLSKIREGIRIRKPVYECEGGIWIKFSLTKNNLELHYKHIPMHPTFDERAPVPRNGSRRRHIMELFYPGKLSAARQREKENKPPKPLKPPKSPKEPRKRKSRDPTGTTSRKRRATEPILQSDSALEPQSAQERQSSLQPLFDFLGSAGRLEEEGTGDSLVATPVDRNAGSAPPALGVGDDVVQTDGDVNNLRKSKEQLYPGMMSGFLHNEEIQWGGKTKPKKKALRPSKRQQPVQNVTPAQPSIGVASREGPPALGNGSPLALPAPSEMDLLRWKLLEAEEKIRLLEGQKAQKQQPAKLVTQQQQAPPPPPPAPPIISAPLPPPPQPFYPHHQHHPPPPGPWQQAPVYPRHSPYYHYIPPKAPPTALSGPSRAPPPRGPPLPLPAPQATHPHDYQQLQTLPPLIQPRGAPSYGFVPNPAEIIATKIKPHLVPQLQNLPGSVPSRPVLPPAHSHNYIAQLSQAASSPQAGNPLQSQSQEQVQARTSGESHTQIAVPPTHRDTVAPNQNDPGRRPEENGSQPQVSVAPESSVQNSPSPSYGQAKAANDDSRPETQSRPHVEGEASLSQSPAAPAGSPAGISTPASAREA